MKFVDAVRHRRLGQEGRMPNKSFGVILVGLLTVGIVAATLLFQPQTGWDHKTLSVSPDETLTGLNLRLSRETWDALLEKDPTFEDGDGGSPLIVVVLDDQVRGGLIHVSPQFAARFSKKP